MPQSPKRRSRKAGLPPGSLVHIGEKFAEQTRINVFDYDENSFVERQVQSVPDCIPFKEKPTVTWIDVDTVHNVQLIEQLGNAFGVHPLVLEDILNTDQRPKMEDYGDYIYVVFKMLSLDATKSQIVSEQVSLIVASNFVISFQEFEGDVFDPIRDRIRTAKGRIRKQGADHLAYSLIDAVVDQYFAILETLGERVQSIEEEVVGNPTPHTLQQIYKLKREMIYLRRAVWPLRDVINGLLRSESPLIHEATLLYLKDIYDHTIHTIDTIETYRDTLAGMLDIYLSSNSIKLNQIMKVLTIITTIFIPLSFIAGVYGMNFDFMPELRSHYGYFITIGVMVVIGVSMLIVFKRRKWL